MAEMQEIQLNLVISAQNLADEALSGVRSALESLSSLASSIFENVAVAAYASANSIEDDFRGLGQVIRDSLQGVASHAFEPMAIAGSEAVKSIEDDFLRLKQAIETDMRQAAESVSRSFRGIGAAPARGGGKKGGLKELFSIQGQMDTLYAGMGMEAVGLPIMGFVKDSVKDYADLDKAITAVNIELTNEKLKMKDLLDLSRELPQTPEQLAQGLYRIAGAGYKLADANKILRYAAIDAAAGQSDIDTTSQALIKVMQSYGLSVDQVKDVSDALFAANEHGTMKFHELASSLGTVSGIAANAGVSYKELVAATAALTNQGLSAQRATEGLRALISGIIHPTKQASEEAQKLGIHWDAATLKAHGLKYMLDQAWQATHGNTEEMKKLIPNIAGYTAAVDLAGKGSQSYKDALDAVNNSSGETEKALDKLKQSASYNLEEFSKSWEDLKLTFAQNVLPVITKVLDKVKELFDWFGHLSPSTQKLISYGILAAGAFFTLGGAFFMTISNIGGIIGGFGKLISVLPQVGGAIRLAFGPWGLIIGGVILGVTLLITHWDKVVKWVKQNFGVTLPQNFEQFKAMVNAVMAKARYYFEIAWNAIRKVVMDAWNYIEPTIVNGLKRVQEFWNEVWPKLKETFQPIIDFIGKHWNEIWNMMKDTLKGIWDGFTGIISTGWDIITGLFNTFLDIINGHWDQAWNDLVKMLQNVFNDINNVIGNLISDAYDWGKNLLKMLADGIMNSIPGLRQAVNTAASIIHDYLGWHSPTREGPGRTSDRWAPNFMRMFSEGIENHIDWVQRAVYHVAESLHDGLSFHQVHAKARSLARTQEFPERLVPAAVPMPMSKFMTLANPFLVPEADNAWDRIPGHSDIHPTVSYYDRRPGHTSHYTININVDGRSKKTDRDLAEHIVSLITRNIKTHR